MTNGPTEVVRDPVEPEPPTPPPAARRRWGLGAFVIAEAVFLLASVLLALPYLDRPRGTPPPVSALLLGLIVPTVLAAAVALLITRWRGAGPRADLGLSITRSDVALGLAFGAGGLLLTVPAAALWAGVVGADKANSAVAALFAGQRVPVPVAVLVFLVLWLVAPLCEEVVFRGLLWGGLERRGVSRWWAFGITTCVFAVAHLEFTRTPLLLVVAVPIGLARVYSGGLGAPIVAHQVNNFLPAVSMLLLMLGVLPPPPVA